jgi:hypothetical protein
MQVDTSLVDRAYENLANAIIESAVNDYRKALKGVTYDRRISPDHLIETLEKFFRSSDFGALTKLDGEYLISRLREEHEKEKE